MRNPTRHLALLLVLSLSAGVGDASPAKDKNQTKKSEDPYAEHVWPPPPDKARIKLDAVITGRGDVEAKSRLRKILIGASPQATYDTFKKPHAVEFDSRGRILVTDWGNSALLRFDRAERRMDVLGTKGSVTLQRPLGIGVGPEDRIYVADAGLDRVVAFDPDGGLASVYGHPDNLVNPTDAEVSPDGKSLYVADSQGHRIVVFDLSSGDALTAFGQRGTEDGEFNYPTALDFGPEGNLFVVDQMSARIQVFSADGEFVDKFGEMGRSVGNFTRPKDVAVDEVGFIYVVDNAFNNFQLFDADFSLLTFVGRGGRGPGQFLGASGVAVRDEEIAVVDQMGQRLQIFRFIVPKSE